MLSLHGSRVEAESRRLVDAMLAALDLKAPAGLGDQLSLLFLQFLTREARTPSLLVLGTYRDVDLQREPALATTLGVIAREARQIELRQLATSDVAELIDRTSGLSPTPELAAAVHERTDGNPFFVTELVRLLSVDSFAGFTAAAVRSARVPAGVQQTIRSRTDQLSAECSHLLRMSAVIGHEFDIEVLGAVYTDASKASTNVQLLQLADGGTMHANRGDGGSGTA